jgi:transcriptional regulator with XRE-family HTH domain
MTTTAEVNLPKLSAMLRTKRGERGLRAVADEIDGVSASTLSRIEQGNLPDIETFMRICKWLGVSPEEFTAEKTKKTGATNNMTDTPQVIEAHLRADRTLPSDTINALSEMIRLAYKAATEGTITKKKR